jgi:hypothetical protein
MKAPWWSRSQEHTTSAAEPPLAPAPVPAPAPAPPPALVPLSAFFRAVKVPLHRWCTNTRRVACMALSTKLSPPTPPPNPPHPPPRHIHMGRVTFTRTNSCPQAEAPSSAPSQFWLLLVEQRSPSAGPAARASLHTTGNRPPYTGQHSPLPASCFIVPASAGIASHCMDAVGMPEQGLTHHSKFCATKKKKKRRCLEADSPTPPGSPPTFVMARVVQCHPLHLRNSSSSIRQRRCPVCLLVPLVSFRHLCDNGSNVAAFLPRALLTLGSLCLYDRRLLLLCLPLVPHNEATPWHSCMPNQPRTKNTTHDTPC